MNEYIGSPWLMSILTELTGVGGVLDTAKIHLFKNDILPGPGTLVSQLDEADYTGYAASAAINWGAPFINANGQGEVVGPGHQFQPTGTAVANTIYGYWIMPTVASTAPIKIVRFAEPVNLTGPADALIVEPNFTVRQP